MLDRTARVAAALLIAAPLAATLSAQNVEYAPGTTKYRLTGTTKGTQILPTGSNSFELGVMQAFTVNLTKAAKDTVKATITLDSIRLTAPGPVPDLSALKGANFVSLMSPTGKLYSASGPLNLDPALGQVVEGVTRILPTFHSNLTKGATWADTVTGKLNQQGLEVNRTTVTKYLVAGDTTIDGQKAVKINKTTTITAAGQGQMGQMPVSMESSGTSTGAFYMTPKGSYLGGRSDDNMSIKITIVGQGAEINIKQSGTTNVEAVK